MANHEQELGVPREQATEQQIHKLSNPLRKLVERAVRRHRARRDKIVTDLRPKEKDRVAGQARSKAKASRR